MDRIRLLTLTRNLYNFKIGYFLRFHHSSILKNNFSHAFFKLPLEENNVKTDQQLNHFSSSPFCTFRQIPNDFAVLQKHRAKAKIKNLSTGKEYHNKFATLGIETLLNYPLGRQMILLMIKMRQHKNGNKFIHICKRNPYANYDFPYITMKDAYLLINGMDSLMSKLADNEDKHPFCEAFIKGINYYDYELKIYPNKKYNTMEFGLETIVKKSKRKVPAKFLPIRVLPSLRDGMAKLLAEYDGSQKIRPLPSTLPKWILENVNIKSVSEEDANNLKYSLLCLYRDTFDYKVINDDKLQERKIQIEYKRGARGKEFIAINQRFDKQMKICKDDKYDSGDKYQYFDFEHIPIEDAPNLQKAMQIMFNDSQKKLQIAQNQLAKGIYFDYKLGIYLCSNKQLNFNMQTIPTDRLIGHVPKKLYGQIPVDVFHWLQEQMAEILLISSSSQKLDQSHDAMEKQKIESNFSRENSTSKGDKIETLHVEKLKYLEQIRDQNETKMVEIRMCQFKNTKKWIFLLTRLFFTDHKMAKIFVPDDAYSMINVMDELMSKIIEQDKPPNCPIPILVRDSKGLIYDYRLGIRPNEDGQLQFTMETITTASDPSHIPKNIFMPIFLLPSLREIMAKMLTEFDGTQQIGPAPSPLPKWILKLGEDSYQQNIVATSAEKANKEELDTIRQEKLDFVVNTFDEKFVMQIIIKLQRNKQDEEFIQIVQIFDKLASSKDIEKDSNKLFFPPIPIIDAYRMPDAMNALSNDLEEKYPNYKIPDDIPPKTSICRQIIRGGLFCDYKLEFCISPLNNQLHFRLETITTQANKFHKPRKLYGPIPVNVFNWLKEQMVEILKSSSNQQEQKICQNEPKKFKEVNGIGQKTANKHNKLHEGLIRREAEYYTVDVEPRDRMIKIELKQGISGIKYIKFGQRFIGEDRVPYFIDFANVPLPEDAYRFLDAMCAMSNELEEKRPTLFIGENKSSLICQQFVKGLFYNCKLELHSLQNQQLDFRLKAMPNRPNKLRESKCLQGPIPINMFNWLKNKMAEILEDYDNSVKNEK